MTAQETVQVLKTSTRWQVQVIPDASKASVLDGLAHETIESAHAALTAYVKAQLDHKAIIGTDPRAAEFRGGVYLTGGPDGWLRVRVVERSAWDCLIAEESDALQSEADEEVAVVSRETHAAEHEAALAEAALMEAKLALTEDETEQARLRVLMERAKTRAAQLGQEAAQQAEERALAAKRAEVMAASVAAVPAKARAR